MPMRWLLLMLCITSYLCAMEQGAPWKVYAVYHFGDEQDYYDCYFQLFPDCSGGTLRAYGLSKKSCGGREVELKLFDSRWDMPRKFDRSDGKNERYSDCWWSSDGRWRVTVTHKDPIDNTITLMSEYRSGLPPTMSVPLSRRPLPGFLAYLRSWCPGQKAS